MGVENSKGNVIRGQSDPPVEIDAEGWLEGIRAERERLGLFRCDNIRDELDAVLEIQKQLNASDHEMSQMLSVGRGTYSDWRTKGTIPLERTWRKVKTKLEELKAATNKKVR